MPATGILGAMNSVEPYRNLWSKVLVLAIEDANLGLPCKAAVEARVYLTTPSVGLEKVCEFAGVAYDRMLPAFQGMYGKHGRGRIDLTPLQRADTQHHDDDGL